MAETILGALAGVSFGLFLWQLFLGIRFPLHQRAPRPNACKRFTVLKPLKGCDSQTADCLRSWLTQDYPEAVQVLFGVESADDPVCDLVRGLISENPGTDAELIICPKLLG